MTESLTHGRPLVMYLPTCVTQDAENFTKGVKFSPDGTCLLTASEDNVIRVFEVPSDVLYQQHSEQQVGSL